MAQDANRDAEFEQARQQLEAAARRIAELSAGAAQPALDVVRNFTMPARRAALGVGIEDDEQGVRVVGVTPGGGADEAGVETGDVIIAMDGASLVGGEGPSPAEVLVTQMGNVSPGDTVALTIMHDGEERDVEVVAQAPRGQTFAFAPGRRADGPPLMFTRPFGRWADMELVELTPGLGTYFGTEEGMLVVRAPRDDVLGLMDGDVILEISGRTPTSVGHALRILGSFEPGEQLELTIMREQRRRTLEVELPRAEMSTD
jgi:S1-C subfamily serine protease